MTTRAITLTGDWTFGSGLGNYLTSSAEIKQNVITRLKCFTNDYFLDPANGLPWFQILSKKGDNQQLSTQVRYEVERAVLATVGVVKLLGVTNIAINPQREVDITLTYQDKYKNIVTSNTTVA